MESNLVVSPSTSSPWIFIHIFLEMPLFLIGFLGTLFYVFVLYESDMQLHIIGNMRDRFKYLSSRNRGPDELHDLYFLTNWREPRLAKKKSLYWISLESFMLFYDSYQILVYPLAITVNW